MGARTHTADGWHAWNSSSTQSVPGSVHVIYHRVKYGTEVLDANNPNVKKTQERKPLKNQVSLDAEDPGHKEAFVRDERAWPSALASASSPCLSLRLVRYSSGGTDVADRNREEEKPSRAGWPDLANKNRERSVKFEFQIKKA